MYLSLLPVSLLLSLAAAQATTTKSITAASAPTGTVCAGPVLDDCLASTEAIAQTCGSTDYQCLCSKWNDVLTCFNVCPSDARYGSILSQQETYCNDNEVYTSSTVTPISRSVTSASSAAPTQQDTGSTDSQTTAPAGAAQTSSGTSSGTSSSASSKSTGKSGAGSNMIIGAGQVVLGVAAAVGVLL